MSSTSNSDIDGIVDDYEDIVNTARWNATDSINMETRGALVQALIDDEMFHKRIINIKEIRSGLDRYKLIKASNIVFGIEGTSMT